MEGWGGLGGKPPVTEGGLVAKRSQQSEQARSAGGGRKTVFSGIRRKARKKGVERGITA